MDTGTTSPPRILLVIGGGIAAYKSLELIRRLRDRGVGVRVVLTRGGSQFVTPLSVASLSGEKVYEDLFSLTDEAEMGHIRLSREADLVVVAPATADLMAKMAGGHADDLASTALLATDKPVMLAPAMNPMMWDHPATRRNVATLAGDGIAFVGPEAGDMACGEVGRGRMAEPDALVAAIMQRFDERPPPAASVAAPADALALKGRRALVTSGPTHEPIDPVRYIANRSSGRQGHAIAAALAAAGFDVTLITGPVALAPPPHVRTIDVETAREMAAAVETALPVDIAVCAAAVADWRPVDPATAKLKKGPGAEPPTIGLTPNPDILERLSKRLSDRPALVVGFAAETEAIDVHARAKLERKGCDWLLANDVSPDSGTFGSTRNIVTFYGRDGTVETWPELDKTAVAAKLAARIAAHLRDCATGDGS